MSEQQERRADAALRLFRAQAVSASQRRLWGELLLTRPPGTLVALILISCTLLAAALLLWLGEFTRTERVTGYLVPEGGVVSIQTPGLGVASHIAVQEGERVQPGQRLLRISDLQALGNGISAGDAMLQTLDHQLFRAQQRRDRELARLQQEQASDQQALQRLDARKLSLNRQLQHMRERLTLLQRALQRNETLARSGHIAVQALETMRHEQLDMWQQVEAANSELLRIADEEAILRQRLDTWPLRRAGLIADLDDHRDRLQKERIETHRQVEFWLRAPSAGRVASLSIVEGEVVHPGRNLLTLLDADARMGAVLLVPSRAIGFVRPGQQVRLLYDAFPFTRFGVHPGTVVRVGRSILSPADLSAPAAVAEPVYKVRVRPQADFIHAHGRNLPLQAGMALEADMELESRRLWQWLLEPLIALRGRL